MVGQRDNPRPTFKSSTYTHHNKSTRQHPQKYAGNNGAFLKDLTECYLKLTTLGYTGTTRNS